MTVTTYIASTQATTRYVGRCVPCVRPVVLNIDGRGDHVTAACPDCSAAVTCERIYGTTSRMACDSRCEGAVGHDCECACGGVNHAGAFLATGTILADALARYRAREAAVVAKREAKRQAATAKLTSEREAFAADHADVVAWLAADSSGFAMDLRFYLARNGYLSDGQVSAVRRSIVRDSERAARDARQAASAVVVPTGRQTVTGVIVSTRCEDTYFGGRQQTVIKCLVDCGGYRLWGTKPAAIAYDANIGDRVTFTATLSPKAGELGFGFFARAAKASIVGSH